MTEVSGAVSPAFEEGDIVEVRRIYLHTYDDGDGDCHDFAPRTVFMRVGNYQEYGDISDVPFWEDCYMVAVSQDVLDSQWAQAGWVPEGNFWIAQEDMHPIDEETDARIRAVIALKGVEWVTTEEVFGEEPTT